MKLWAALRQAWLGWVDIVRLRPDWDEHFGFSLGALAKALVIFFLFAFLAIAMGSMQGGLPSLPGLLANLLVQSLGLVAVLIGIVVTKLAVRSEVPVLRVLVPGIYGMVFYLVAGSVLAAISIETVTIVLLGLVFLLYSLGRAAGGWTLGVSLAFGVLTVVLLVGMPLTLYMLALPPVPPSDRVVVLAQKSSTFLDELVNAARGCFALLTGNREAATHFDFSQRGLIGSIIAFLIASALGAYGAHIFGMPSAPGAATQQLVLGAVLFLVQLGVSYLVLRQMGRLDGFIPFLVADNWATFFTSILSLFLVLFGGPSDLVIIAIGIVVIIVEINIARLIVTLAPGQIAIFIGTQVVAAAIGLLLLGGMIPSAPGAS